MRITDLKIGTRLAVGFATMLVIMSAITGIAIWRLSRVADLTRQTLQVPLEKERLASDWYRLIALGARRSIAIAKSSDPSLEAFFASDAKATSELSFKKRDGIQALLESPEEKALYEQLAKHQKVNLGSRAELFKAKNAGNTAEADRIFNQVYLPNLTEYQAVMERFEALQRANIDASAKRIDAIYASSRDQILVLGAAGLAFCALFVWLLTRSITGPLGRAVRVAQTVAQGRLDSSIEARSRDETGQLLVALKEMNDNLAGLVLRVRGGTAVISSSSSEIAAGNIDLSSRTEEQASSLEETAASMEQLTATVRENADRATQANGLALAASEDAEEGGALVKRVVETMATIHDSSRRIAEITSVIDGIAFQTNILALNAAVEAARAGDQGRGFAVVAAEVRALAQRSAAAAKEINSLISESGRTIEAGNELVTRAGGAIAKVVESTQRVTTIMGDIAAGSQEQASGIAQINEAVSQMERVTQQNASLVEQAAAASQSMHEQASELEQAVAAFRVSDELAVEPRYALHERRQIPAGGMHLIPA